MKALANNENVLVSVIVPTYKRNNALLSRSIESLLNQTHKNIEIIIVDDNQVGDQYNIVTELLINLYLSDSRIKYLKTEVNSGVALSRNLGISKSTGKYITFLDDDDMYLSDKITYQLDYMLKNELDMTFTDIALHNHDNILIDYRRHDYVKSFENSNLMKLHVMHNLTGTPTYMFKASSLKEIGCFDNSILSEEYYLMEKAINRGLKIGYIPKSHVIAFRHNMGGESFGIRKIAGEKLLYQSKKKHFHMLSKHQIRYTKCRYYAVMAVSCFRAKKYIFALFFSIITFISGPIIVLKELKKKKKILKKYKKDFML